MAGNNPRRRGDRPVAPTAHGARSELPIPGGRVYFSRRYQFAAAHRMFRPEYSDAENARVFGKCSNPRGHGHNYQLTVTVAGEVDPKTGFCIDLAQLDKVVKERVLDRYDHRHLNLDTEDYTEQVATGENIAQQIWRLLEPALPPGALHRIQLWETPNNSFDYYGERSARAIPR